MLFKTETEIINEICVVYEKTFFKLFQFFCCSSLLTVFRLDPVSFRANNVSFLSYYTDIISFLQFCEHQENMVRPFVQLSFFSSHLFLTNIQENVVAVFTFSLVVKIRLVFGYAKLFIASFAHVQVVLNCYCCHWHFFIRIFSFFFRIM